MSLKLKVKKNGSVKIGDATVTIEQCGFAGVKLSIDAPPEVVIHRDDIVDRSPKFKPMNPARLEEVAK